MLAGLLLVVDVLLYIPILTDVVPTGGDMVGLGYVMIGLCTTIGVVVVTVVAFSVVWLRHRTSW